MADQGPSHSNVNIATPEEVARHLDNARRLNLDGIATPRLMEEFVNEYFTTRFEDTEDTDDTAMVEEDEESNPEVTPGEC